MLIIKINSIPAAIDGRVVVDNISFVQGVSHYPGDKIRLSNRPSRVSNNQTTLLPPIISLFSRLNSLFGTKNSLLRIAGNSSKKPHVSSSLSATVGPIPG